MKQTIEKAGIKILPNKPRKVRRVTIKAMRRMPKIKPPKYGRIVNDTIAYLSKNRKKIGHVVICVEVRDGYKLPSVGGGQSKVDGACIVGNGWSQITEVEKAMIRRLSETYTPKDDE